MTTDHDPNENIVEGADCFICKRALHKTSLNPVYQRGCLFSAELSCSRCTTQYEAMFVAGTGFLWLARKSSDATHKLSLYFQNTLARYLQDDISYEYESNPVRLFAFPEANYAWPILVTYQNAPEVWHTVKPETAGLRPLYDERRLAAINDLMAILREALPFVPGNVCEEPGRYGHDPFGLNPALSVQVGDVRLVLGRRKNVIELIAHGTYRANVTILENLAKEHPSTFDEGEDAHPLGERGSVPGPRDRRNNVRIHVWSHEDAVRFTKLLLNR